MDALYAQTPALALVRKNGWDAVLSLKQNSRDLYQSAVRLFAARPPDADFTEQRDHKTYRVQLWDTEGLPFTIDNPEPVRVVRSEEMLDRNRYREGELSSHSTDHEWLWFTTRSEEHTSELQSHHDLVCRLLLEKKKKPAVD